MASRSSIEIAARFGDIHIEYVLSFHKSRSQHECNDQNFEESELLWTSVAHGLYTNH